MLRLVLLPFVAAPILLTSIVSIPAEDEVVAPQPTSASAINEADLGAHFASPQRSYIIAPEATASDDDDSSGAPALPDPAIARLQILLDQQGASPGVIDGFDGENMRKAVMGIQAMAAMPMTGIVDDSILALVETGQPVMSKWSRLFDLGP